MKMVEEKSKQSADAAVRSAPASGKSGKIAAVRIRSAIHADGAVKDTLEMLKLRRKNACVILDDTPSLRGMIVKAKDFITYGEVSPDVVKLLEEKRGRKGKDGKLLNVFLLHPPRGGFERKGIKLPFNLGGALGYRGTKIDDLLKRMV